MSAVPLVTILTPTWQRHDLLLSRCIPSVQAQGHPGIEHLVVSDGPDPVLRERLAEPWRDGWRSLWYRELPEHDPAPHFGHHARAYGLEIAAGEYVAYLDDDDSFRPEHVHMLAAALDANPGAGFAVAQMLSHGPHGDTVIGTGPLAAGDLGTPMVMHRRELAETAGGWTSGGRFEDWSLVLRWLNAGVPYVRVDRVTCDSWPSAWRRESVLCCMLASAGETR